MHVKNLHPRSSQPLENHMNFPCRSLAAGLCSPCPECTGLIPLACPVPPQEPPSSGPGRHVPAGRPHTAGAEISGERQIPEHPSGRGWRAQPGCSQPPPRGWQQPRPTCHRSPRGGARDPLTLPPPPGLSPAPPAHAAPDSCSPWS